MLRVSDRILAVLEAVKTAVQGATPAGTNTIGNVGIVDPAGKRALATTFGEATMAHRQAVVQGRPTYGAIPHDINPIKVWTLSGETGGSFAVGDLVRGQTSGAVAVVVEISPAFRLREIGQVEITSTETIARLEGSTVTGTVTAGAYGDVTVTSANALKVEAGTDTDHTIRAETRESATYHAGNEGYAFFTAIWPDGGSSGVTQYIGLLRSDEGVFVGFNGTNFVVGYRRNGSDTTVAQASWNQDTADGNGASGFNMDTTKVNIFHISYGYLGTAPINVFVVDETGQFVHLHRFALPNTQTDGTFVTPVFPIGIEIAKVSGGSVTPEIRTYSWNAGHVIGRTTLVDDMYTSYVSASVSTGADRLLCAIKNNWTISGSRNLADIYLKRLALSSEGNNPVVFRFWKNPVLSADLTYASADPASVASTSTTAATYSAGGTLVFAVAVAKTDSKYISFEDHETDNFTIFPGEIMVITVESAATTTAAVSLSWVEETAS